MNYFGAFLRINAHLYDFERQATEGCQNLNAQTHFTCLTVSNVLDVLPDVPHIPCFQLVNEYHILYHI